MSLLSFGISLIQSGQSSSNDHIIVAGVEQASVSVRVCALDADASPRADPRAGDEAAEGRPQPEGGPRVQAAPDGADQPGGVHEEGPAGAQEEARPRAQAAAKVTQAARAPNQEAAQGHLQNTGTQTQ